MTETDDIRCLVITDFNAANLVALLRNDSAPPRLEVRAAPYGQVMPVLLQAGHECWDARVDVALVWTQPEAVVEQYRRALEWKSFDVPALLGEVDAYCAALAAAAPRAGSLLVPTWTGSVDVRAYSLLSMKSGQGPVNALLRMNLRLVETLERLPNVHVMDAGCWMAHGGRSEKLWYLAKVPFATGVFEDAARNIKSALRGLRGEGKKLVALDLDDTLWGGIVGDAGWENLTLGGHNPVGEAFVDFQRALKALTRCGVLLAIVSRNDEAMALEAIRCHPEMVLREDDFVGWRINWGDKAQNLLDLVAELNIGLQSVVFIDNSLLERARVREALPEVLVPEWPVEKTGYRRALLGLDCFDTPSVSEEDRKRTVLYASGRKRDDLRQGVGSLDEWLCKLQLVIRAEPLAKGNLARAAQLFNKTNQMNLRTRRLTARELEDWAIAPGHALWALYVSDRLGDSGLTGIVSLAEDNGDLEIVDFLLSCRVMGRRVEESMLHLAVEHARRLGLARVRAVFSPTPRNKPCLDFFKGSGFARESGTDVFTWACACRYPAPGGVTLDAAAVHMGH